MDFSKLQGEKTRYITGVALVILVGVVLAFNDVRLVWAVLGVAYLLGFYEALKLYEKIHALSFSFWHYGLALVVWGLAYISPRPIESALFVGMFFAGALAFRGKDSRQILPLLYPTLPFVVLLALFKDFGVRGVLWLVVVVVVADVGAYFGGRLLGRIPLSPTSPKKTLEGSLIGLALASLLGGLAGLWSVGFVGALGMSVVVALSAILGDLFESYLKRRAEVKDSGACLPGHGGILDRLDAMLFGGVSLHFLLLFAHV
ncbi:phosphatidate cytidylyltransferase [Helicobacter felis]|uniref:Phosphatidate cytidylyltransferase n=1 Tax=Helicobacter felis (strain ATCC 49179 / CCUG 28539 / NCTC 12436 / CS1) TaxID=936155 RepID=E7ACP0_HELFC|nr:phosphatidate cytidylyltransferase [Helicobacter felis]CBY83071.1 phosphatidate cytidylyltransferase [Helicobacter felis ATCC 49179]